MKYLKLLKYSFLFLLFLIACKSEEGSIDNIISSELGEFKLYKGYQYQDGETLSTGSTPFNVFLLGEGVQYDEAISEMSGIGSIIEFTMYSGNEYEIENGFYTIDIFSYDSIGYAGDCKIYYNYDFDEDTGKIFNVEAGTFDVENLGSVMKYDISVVADTLLFDGIFRGPILSLD